MSALTPSTCLQHPPHLTQRSQLVFPLFQLALVSSHPQQTERILPRQRVCIRGTCSGLLHVGATYVGSMFGGKLSLRLEATLTLKGRTGYISIYGSIQVMWLVCLGADLSPRASVAEKPQWVKDCSSNRHLFTSLSQTMTHSTSQEMVLEYHTLGQELAVMSEPQKPTHAVTSGCDVLKRTILTSLGQ